jgi:hypothetical protein
MPTKRQRIKRSRFILTVLIRNRLRLSCMRYTRQAKTSKRQRTERDQSSDIDPKSFHAALLNAINK